MEIDLSIHMMNTLGCLCWGSDDDCSLVWLQKSWNCLQKWLKFTFSLFPTFFLLSLCLLLLPWLFFCVRNLK